MLALRTAASAGSGTPVFGDDGRERAAVGGAGPHRGEVVGTSPEVGAAEGVDSEEHGRVGSGDEVPPTRPCCGWPARIRANARIEEGEEDLYVLGDVGELHDCPITGPQPELLDQPVRNATRNHREIGISERSRIVAHRPESGCAAWRTLASIALWVCPIQ